MMSPLFSVFLLAILFCISWISLKIFQQHTSGTLKGPKTSWNPFIGNLHEMESGPETILPTIQKWQETYGTIFKVWYGLQPTIILSDPKLIKTLLSRDVDINYYCKGYDNEFRPWLGNSILLSTGDEWRHKRKILNQAFHHTKLKAIIPVVISCCNKLITKWKAQIEDDPNVAFDLHSELTKMSLDIIGQSAFDFDFGAVGTYSGKTEISTESPILTDFQTILNEIEARSYDALPMPNFVYLNYTASGKRFTKAVCNLREKVGEIIEKRRNHPSDVGDLLSLLMEATDGNSPAFSDDEISEDVMTFLFAGHETTSTAICWTLYLIFTHPQVEWKLLGELQPLFQSNSDELSDRILKSPYLNMVVQESLRLYPPQPAFVRRAVKDTSIDIHPIPSGTEVSIVPYLVHRNKDFWPDPESFIPERFAESTSVVGAHKRQPFDYIPFSGGNRSCIGERMALMECKLVVAHLLHHFRMSIIHPESVKPLPAVTLRPNKMESHIVPRSINK